MCEYKLLLLREGTALHLSNIVILEVTQLHVHVWYLVTVTAYRHIQYTTQLNALGKKGKD